MHYNRNMYHNVNKLWQKKLTIWTVINYLTIANHVIIEPYVINMQYVCTFRPWIRTSVDIIGDHQSIVLTRDKSILPLFSPIFLSGNFFLPIMLQILLQLSTFCSKLSYIASYLTVISYTLYTSTAYTCTWLLGFLNCISIMFCTVWAHLNCRLEPNVPT